MYVIKDNVAMAPQDAAFVKSLLTKFTLATCDVLASGVSVAAALSLVQGFFGALGAILSVVYLVIRIRSARKDK